MTEQLTTWQRLVQDSKRYQEVFDAYQKALGVEHDNVVSAMKAAYGADQVPTTRVPITKSDRLGGK